jgi:hypothetical protein
MQGRQKITKKGKKKKEKKKEIPFLQVINNRVRP